MPVKRERSPNAEAPCAKRHRNKARGGHQPAASFALMTNGGKKFCVAWNRGKCSKHHKDCPRQELHFSNVMAERVMSDTKPCDHSSLKVSPPSLLSGKEGLHPISAGAETVKFTEILKIAAGSVVFKVAECAAVSRKLAAAKSVRWRGKGELLHLPWDPPSLGPFLLIDLWSGFAGAAMALLSMGVSVYCLAAETDPFVARSGRREFGRDCACQLRGRSVG